MRQLIFYVIWVVSCSVLFPSDTGNHHHRLEEEVDLISRAEEELQNLKNELASFLEHKEKIKKDNEILLKEIGEWDNVQKEIEGFREGIRKLEKDFLVFRESLGQFIAETDSYSPHARTLRAMSILNVTEWYVNHIKTVIFPEDWKRDERK